MGFISGVFSKIIKLILYFAIVVAFIILIPNLPPYTKFSRIEIEPTRPRIGALSPNSILNNAEALYKDKLLGPEAFQIWNGDLYTGLVTGEIVKVSPGGHVTFVTKIGQPCTGLTQDHICGRPLGFVIDERTKVMYVADAYYGIWKVNLITDKKQLLVSPQVAINGKPPKLFNAVALDKNGDLYWTDSSSDFQLKDGLYSIFSDPAGRLFAYNAAKNSSKVLLDNLWFPNGVDVSPDNQFVVVAETSKFRLLKYYINGPKRGSSEVLVAGLPGCPDNIRTLPDGSGLLVSLYTVFDDEDPIIAKSLAAAPLARKFLSRVMRLVEIPFEFLQSHFPNYIFESLVHQIGSFTSASAFQPKTTGLVQIDWNGNIVASYYNTDKSVHHISDAIVYNNKLHLATPFVQNFIGAVPVPPQLLKAFTINKTPVKEQPKEEKKLPELNKPVVEDKKQLPKNTKPTEEPKKQTTTTPKPTTKPSEIPKKTVPVNVQPKDIPEKVKSQETKPKSADVKSNAAEKDKTTDSVKKSEPKAVPKQAEQKPNAIPKATESKPKVNAKETEKPPKPSPKTETKPKPADPQPKVKVEPVKAAQPKPSEAKQEVKNKPVVNEPKQETKTTKNDKAEVKNKPIVNEPKIETKTKTDNVEAQKSSAPGQTKPEAKVKPAEPKIETKTKTDNVEIKKGSESGLPKPEAKNKPVVNEPKKEINTKTDNADAKNKPVDNEPKIVIKTKTDNTEGKKGTESGQSKTTTSKTETKTSQTTEKKPTQPKKPTRTPPSKPIPVEEKIPSDTAMPKNEKLKVIKKSGPQEIPNPGV